MKIWKLGNIFLGWNKRKSTFRWTQLWWHYVFGRKGGDLIVYNKKYVIEKYEWLFLEKLVLQYDSHSDCYPPPPGTK